jgi:predicted TIM-barrel fold metal-dependent hydrolase
MTHSDMAAVSATPASNINRPPAQLEEWLALRTEAPLEPAQPILDAHIHLWNGNRGRFIANEFRSGAQGHNVLAALFVQCYTHYRPCGPDLEQPLGETEFVVKLAEAENLVEEAPVMAPSIVGFANLAYGARIRPMLEQHIQLAKGRFRGVRHGLQYSASGVGRNGPWQPANGQMYTADFREGFAELEPLGLSFDAWLYHPQIPDLVDLAKAFPGTSIVLDHVGMPLGVGPYRGKRDEVFAEWKVSMARLAELPNVVVKVGGLGMLYHGFDFELADVPPSSEMLARAWRPYIESVIETFGTERCMLESNFPVDAQTCSYGVLWNAFKRITSGCSLDEKHALYVGTTARTYRLPQFDASLPAFGKA